MSKQLLHNFIFLQIPCSCLNKTETPELINKSFIFMPPAFSEALDPKLDLHRENFLRC